jgi:hypothetical protein
MLRTLAVIAAFRHDVLGAPAPALARLEREHPALAALNAPLPALSVRFELTGAVGAGAANAAADARVVQARLRDLRFLSLPDWRAESAAAAPGAPTFAALARFRALMLNLPAGAVEPLDATHLMLRAPFRPPPVPLRMARDVGRGAAPQNVEADVRAVQDRLHQLGILGTLDYLAERAPAAGVNRVPPNQLGQTIDAIIVFQQTIAAVPGAAPDGVVGAHGHTARALRDPTWSTPTIPNANCNVPEAGPPLAVAGLNAQQSHELAEVTAAIQAHEAGVRTTGEIPPTLRNGSQTPASWGKAQTIGASGVDAIDNHADLQQYYDLTAADVRALQDLARRTSQRFNAIVALVPVGGETEANLQARITAFTPGNLAAFHADTGLGAADIATMFRTGQLRRHVFRFAPNLAGMTDAQKATAVNNALAAFNADADASANAAALGVGDGDLRAYLRRTAALGENHAGFVTRALFYSEHGQTLRNAFTDDSGFKFGLREIQGEFVRVWNTAGAQALTPRQRALIVAHIHNHGAAAPTIAQMVANVGLVDPIYTGHVMPFWDAHHVPFVPAPPPVPAGP